MGHPAVTTTIFKQELAYFFNLTNETHVLVIDMEMRFATTLAELYATEESDPTMEEMLHKADPDGDLLDPNKGVPPTCFAHPGCIEGADPSNYLARMENWSAYVRHRA